VGYASNWSPKTDIVKWGQASLMAVFDKDPLFPYRPSPSLLWLLELSGGLTEIPTNKAVVSAGMHALLGPWVFGGWRPFVSGGIGGIYTDFQVQGQGVRVNFNPQVGLGAEIKDRGLFTVRVHHLSNAETNPENTGVNSILAIMAIYM
jgi:lipid A 3-O-deacylase